MRILLTTTSYQDTPGAHHDLLHASGFEVVRDRGPLTDARMLELIAEHQGFDGLLNGDDAISARVIDAARAAPTPLRVIAKYGIGLDSIDVPHATECRIPVLFTPGVNHTTVAEHCFGLMITLSKKFYPHIQSVKAGGWKRSTGIELAGKTLGFIGLGRITREVIKRAQAFDMKVVGYGRYWDDEYCTALGVQRFERYEDLLAESDVVSLHTHLTDATRHMINTETLKLMRSGALLINTARGGLIDETAVAEACRSGHLGGYGADVLGQEPPEPGHCFNDIENVIITPHIGSRTLESVGRQALRATTNLIEYLNGGTDYIQANEIPK